MKRFVYPAALLLISALLLGFSSCTSDSKATGTALVLRYETKATQPKGSDMVSLDVSLYLDYNKVNVGARSTNTLTVNGETQNFKTEAISDKEKGSSLLTSYTVLVKRQIGNTVNCPISASWQFGGVMDGETLTWLTQNGTIILNDGNVTMTDAAPTNPMTTEPVEPDTQPPVTSPGSTLDTEPVTEPVVTPPVTEPGTEPPAVTPPGPNELGEPVLNTFEGALMSWSMAGSSGTKLNLYAECGAYDLGNGRLKISVALYLTHSSLSISERGEGWLLIGGQRVSFRVPETKTENNDQQYTWLVTAEAEVDATETYKIEASTPMGVVYSGVSIPELTLSGTFTAQEIA